MVNSSQIRDSNIELIYSLTERIEKCENVRDLFKGKDYLILLRAARGTGKTIFCKLLRKFLLYQDKNDPNSLKMEHVFFINLMRVNSLTKLQSILAEQTGYPDLESINKNLKNCILIFDEIQNTYNKEYDPFWNSIKGLIQGDFENIKSFMVASYNPKDIGTWISPPEIANAISLSIHFLYCTKKEMVELNNYFNSDDEVKTSGLQIDNDVRDAIFNFTGGHIGLISKIYLNIFRKFSPNKKSVTQEEIFHYFYSGENMKALETYRSFNDVYAITEKQKELLRTLYFENSLHVTRFPQDDLASLLKLGIIDYTQPNSKEVTWSFEMMKMYLMPHLFSSDTRPLKSEFQEKYKGSLNTFIWDALERYSPKQLRNGIGKETEYLREAHVVVEFYRVISSLIPTEYSIFLEIGKDLQIEQKRLDFYINDETQWAIEFVVETNDIEGHAGRFDKVTGIYKNAKKKDYAVIHFVSHHKKGSKNSAEVDGVWRIELDKLCNTAQVSPWIRKDINDTGKRGAIRKVIFKGDHDRHQLDKKANEHSVLALIKKYLKKIL